MQNNIDLLIFEGKNGITVRLKLDIDSDTIWATQKNIADICCNKRYMKDLEKIIEQIQ